MSRALLITGKQSSFTDDLIQEALGLGARVMATHDPTGPEPEVPDSFGDSLSYVPWNSRSLISARTVGMAAVNQFQDDLNDIVVVCGPMGVGEALHETPAVDVETSIDTSLKGYLFIIKEAIAQLMRRGAGRLSVVWYDGGAEIVPPIEAVLAGGIHALIPSLLSFYADESVEIAAYQASVAERRDVARWVMEHTLVKPERSGGRIHKYGQRMGLRGFRK